MTIGYFDIETVPGTGEAVEAFLARKQLKHTRTKPDDLRDKLSLNALYNQIVCISYAFDQERPITYVAHPADEYPEIDEAELIRKFFTAVDNRWRQGHPFIWTGHNISNFDLPMLRVKAFRYMLTLPRCFPMSSHYRAENVYDTMMEFSGGLNPKWTDTTCALDDICTVFGLPHDTDLDGSQIRYLWDAGDYKAIGEKCEADVVGVRALYHRLHWNKQPTHAGSLEVV